jgi:hypothetical protein
VILIMVPLPPPASRPPPGERKRIHAQRLPVRLCPARGPSAHFATDRTHRERCGADRAPPSTGLTANSR